MSAAALAIPDMPGKPEHVTDLNWSIMALYRANPGVSMGRLAELCAAAGLRGVNGQKLTRNAVISRISRNTDLLPPALRPKRAVGGVTPATVALGPTTPACQWPIGNPGQPGFRFCGSPNVVPGKPYCLDHCKAAYRKPTRAEKAAAGVLKRLAGRG